MPLFPPPRGGFSSYGPAERGLLAESFPPEAGQVTGLALTPAGTLWTSRLYLDRPQTITNLHIMVLIAGGTLTANQCLAALFSSTGTLLSSTGNQATAWASTGFKTMALTAAQTVPAGFVDVGFYYQGTTGPGFTRATSTSAPWMTANQAGNSIKYATTSNTGLTTAMPGSLGTKTASGTGYWVAVS